MFRNTIKKSLPMLAGALIIALVVSILPSGYFAEASKNITTKVVAQKYITLEQAEQIALTKVNDKKAEIVDFEIELTGKKPNYDFKLVTDLHEYEIEINAITGEIIDFEKDSINDDKHDDNDDDDDDADDDDDDDRINKKDNTQISKPVVEVKYITKEKAIQIAIARIGSNATLEEIEFDKGDNPPKYEIEMYDDKYEYEIEIHAITGAVLDFEREED